MPFDRLKRREFITLLGGATAWPFAARTQQPAMPVIGFLNSGLPETSADYVKAFVDGLREYGYIPDQNIAIEFRWAHGQTEQLPALAADLLQRRVAVLATGGGFTSARAAKAATSTIPIVFAGGGDPVQLGLVASLNHPGGNATGVTNLAGEVNSKRFQMLRELIPGTSIVGILVDPNTPEGGILDIVEIARATGQETVIVKASTQKDLDVAFETLVRKRIGALFVGASAFFNTQRDRLVSLTARQGLPAIYDRREFPVAGGLISYGTNLREAYRQLGVYTGRVLKGEKPANLPVIQSVKFELVINRRTARALDLTVPATLLALADEVIE
jgi:putative ABC transport system substrate-binding protein